jgi:tripartite-type tricarboxylate transporter receptor subunit TctC
MAREMGRGVRVIPLNVEAGGGGKGVAQLYRAPADGSIIGMLSLPSIFALQYVRKIEADYSRFTWLSTITTGEPYGLAVAHDSSVRTMPDLLAVSKRRPVSFTASGPEGVAYFVTIVASELLGLRARLITGYRSSSDYIFGAVRGDADAVIAGLSTLVRMQRGGTLRILASFEAHSSIPGVPDASALHTPELAQLTGLRVIAAPPGLPEPVKSVLAAGVAAALADRAVAQFAARNGEQLQPLSPARTEAIALSQQRFFQRWRGTLDSYRRGASS